MPYNDGAISVEFVTDALIHYHEVFHLKKSSINFYRSFKINTYLLLCKKIVFHQKNVFVIVRLQKERGESLKGLSLVCGPTLSHYRFRRMVKYWSFRKMNTKFCLKLQKINV